jgi:hypothetical protein
MKYLAATSSASRVLTSLGFPVEEKGLKRLFAISMLADVDPFRSKFSSDLPLLNTETPPSWAHQIPAMMAQWSKYAGNLQRFRNQVKRSLAERDLETTAGSQS